jgi:WD40 repeat protein
LNLLERIQDVDRFMTFFRTPISTSTPHMYISTGPFLPSDSHLSTIFSTHFTKGIKMERGKLLSWPALEWIGHDDGVTCISYSPDGCYIVTGSDRQQFGSGMPRLAMRSVSLWRGTLMKCGQLPTLRWAAHHLWIL